MPVDPNRIIVILYRKQPMTTEAIERKINELEAEISKLQCRADQAASSYEVRETWVHIGELEDQVEELKKQLADATD